MSEHEVLRDALQHWAVSQGYAYARVLLDGRLVCVEPLFARQALLVLTTPGLALQDGWIYASLEAALAAAKAWDATAEPSGWLRHPQSGRRRPGGDPAREYVVHKAPPSKSARRV
jgi:hypothetical protein